MSFHLITLFLQFLSLHSQNQQLDTIKLQAHPLVQSAADFAVADQVIDHQKACTRWGDHWRCFGG